MYFRYDPRNDLLYAPRNDRLDVYHCATNSWKSVNYPFSSFSSPSTPCCCDKKRGLFVISLVGPYTFESLSDEEAYAKALTDVWFYDGAKGTWHKKTPAIIPPFYKGRMDFDSKNDKYVYFGAGRPDYCTGQVWVYDYDSNAWTEMDRTGKSYDDNNQATSTWAPGYAQHTWRYCERYNIFACYGGKMGIDGPGPDLDPACCDFDEQNQPIWIYRLANDSLAGPVEFANGGSLKYSFSVIPNPFKTTTRITLNFNNSVGQSELSVFDVQGKLVRDLTQRLGKGTSVVWQVEDLASGWYFIRLLTEKGNLEKKVILIR
jgi:hypothetical protein